eukprot:CAMPEP_0180405218 /NCGR_PEP_ID=MMETSP0989-20121125/40478_1 /TAXON_ID=697907 /ORGANISM="non described non described, Strain CCMP2293" /LENGTH=346 /DNA_ID=CAMNT_0022408779 /DNA_START=40 /DNA_END=1082 /DNA_ORIENTATION=+
MTLGVRARRGPAPFHTLSMGSDVAVTTSLQPTPLPMVKAGYTLAWFFSLLAWFVCSGFSLATHATLTLPVVHNALCILQAVTPLPILFAVCATLIQASKLGWDALGKPQMRRLNLGLAFASLWFAFCVAFAPLASNARVTYPATLMAAALITHLSTAAFSFAVWLKATPGVGLTTDDHLRGDRIAVPDHAGGREWGSDAQAGLRRAQRALFPRGSVRGVYGDRDRGAVPARGLSAEPPRPPDGAGYGGFMLLSASVFYVLKIGVEQKTCDTPGDSMMATLRTGVAVSSVAHLLLIPARLILEPGVPLYPGTFACPWWSLTAIFAYLLAATQSVGKIGKNEVQVERR